MKILKADSFKKRLIGLMFKNKVDYALLLPKTNKIHTFMMRFSIDLIIINEHNFIIDIKKNIPKNKIIIIKNKRKNTNILEIPSYIKHNYKINTYLK